jgi:hypothetical protein
MKLQQMNPDQPRPIHVIGLEIQLDWENPHYAAVPYLRAMRALDDIDDQYGLDPAAQIVRYFLANARGWRGEKAREIKAELKALLK